MLEEFQSLIPKKKIKISNIHIFEFLQVIALSKIFRIVEY